MKKTITFLLLMILSLTLSACFNDHDPQQVLYRAAIATEESRYISGTASVQYLWRDNARSYILDWQTDQKLGQSQGQIETPWENSRRIHMDVQWTDQTAILAPHHTDRRYTMPYSAMPLTPTTGQMMSYRILNWAAENDLVASRMSIHRERRVAQGWSFSSTIISLRLDQADLLSMESDSTIKFLADDMKRQIKGANPFNEAKLKRFEYVATIRNGKITGERLGVQWQDDLNGERSMTLTQEILSFGRVSIGQLPEQPLLNVSHIDEVLADAVR